ncbi:golgin subfamily A member 4-like isoform X3 [Palaemon carinicauda]|uniref:golgin subfamily A member 4-like isoform X3 n=1 Tax=Palaemon carinicauda TaxID=392227 RepID=UPI0035B67BCF
MDKNDDEANYRPQKRKKTVKEDLSMGPKMSINAPFNIQSATFVTSIPGDNMETTIETGMVVEIQEDEEQQAKQLANQAMQQLSHFTSSGPTEKGALQSMHKKIKEYQTAVTQRDDLIGKLQSRLAETLQQRDELITSSQEQETSFRQETEKLRMQLQQAIDMVTNQKTGVNPRDHLELKNKLIALQQEKSQQETTIKQLSGELETRIEVYGQLDYKYKQILLKFKKLTNDAKIYQEEKVKLESEIVQLKEDQKTQLATWEGEKEVADNRITSLEQEKSSLSTENTKMRDEIQNLMQKLQKLAEEVEEKEKKIETTRAHAEEQFGIQLTLIKKQMSDIHAEEISKVSQEIDALQQTHQENIASLSSINMNLKSQFEAEQKKVQCLEAENKALEGQLEEVKTSKNEQNEKLMHKEAECNELHRQLEEAKASKNEQNEKLKIKEAECSEMHRQLEEMKASKNEQNEILLKKEAECHELHRHLEEVKAWKIEQNEKLLNKEAECNETNNKLSECEQNFSKLQTEYQSILIKEKEWLSEKERLIEEIRKSELLIVEVSKLEEEVKMSMQIEKEFTILKEENNSLILKCSELNSQVEKLTLEKRELEDEDKKRKEENHSLNVKLQEETKLIASLEGECEHLNQEQNKIRTENVQLCSHIEDLKGKVKNHVNREVELDAQIETAKCETRKLEEELKKEKDDKNLVTIKLQDENKQRLDFENKWKHMKLENEKLVKDLDQLSTRIKELETENQKSDELRHCIVALEAQCREAKEVKEEYEKKCISLNEKLLSLDEKLAEAHKLHLKSDKASLGNSSRKNSLDRNTAALDECKNNLTETEEELKQLKEKCEKIERDKVEVETERDELMERYKMMNAELASTMLALDREIQLTTHRRLSDIGSSLSRGFGDLATQTDLQLSGESLSSAGNSERDVLLEEADVCVPVAHSIENQDLDQQVSDPEKDNKDLLNEAEKLRMKLKDQSLIVKSYENQNATLKRRLVSLEEDNQRLKSEQEEYRAVMLEKLECQRQLTELRLSKNIQDQSLLRLEQNDDNVSYTLESVESPFLESQMRESLSSSVFRNLDDTAEFESFKDALEKALSKVLNELERLDRVNKEKYLIELENISLREQVSQLASKQPQLSTKDERQADDVMPSRENVLQAEDKSPATLQKEIQKYKFEIGTLQRIVERQAILFDLEKQHLNSPQLKLQVSYIMQDQSKSLGESLSTDKLIEFAMKNLRQAILKNVSGQYMQALTKTLNKLEDVILTAIHNPSVEVVSDSTQSSNNIGQLSESKLGVSLEQDVKMFTENVEQLINIRTTLVDASNELVEQLEEAVTQRISHLKLEIEDLVNLTAQGNVGTSVTKADTSTRRHFGIECYQDFILEFVEVTNNIAEEAQGEKLQILESQQALIQKILEDNKLKVSSLGQERLQHLEKVKNLPDAIKCTSELMSSLETTLAEEITWVNQQYKELLTQYSYEQELRKKSHTSKLKELESTLISLLENSPLEVELAKMASSHKTELEKLKEQHCAEVKHLEDQIALQDNEMLVSTLDEMALDDEVLQLHARAERDLSHRSESSYVSCSQLDNIKIQVTQRHLQSLYSDREWYRKTVGLLSHVALQLLHYFTVAESYIKKPQTPQMDDWEIQDESTLQQPDSISGMAKDLSFLSDCKSDFIGDNVLSTFPEDNAMSTALIGKSVQVDHCEDLEMVSNSGSVLDSTVMSEGMLEDMDKDEQVRSMLTKFYPQLMSILKGRWERVVVENLEKEVQELTIALQASAGMLKIFMHSVISETKGLPSLTVPHESAYLRVGAVSHNREAFTDIARSKTPDPNQTLPIASCAKQAESECHSLFQENHPSKSDISSHFGDITHLTHDLASILSHEETILDFTVFKTPKLDTKEKITAFVKELCRMAEKIESLQLQAHHQAGLIQGFEEERRALQDENNRLEHYSKKIVQELQVTKDQLADYEREADNKNASSSSYAEKLEASKDTKERVRAVLSAKTKSSMDHGELVTRNADLERLLESLVRDYDKEVEELKCKAADLSQQLEVADRQLRSNRQFLDEQAIEREKEREEMQKENENFAAQLRDKNNLQLQHENLSNKVECLDRELQDKVQELEDALANLKKGQAKIKAAEDKISDQRETISSLEAQLDARNKTEKDLYIQNENLLASCNEYQKENQELRSKLEEHLCAGDPFKSQCQEDTVHPKKSSYNPMETEDSMVHRDGKPLSQELLDSSESEVLLEQNLRMVFEKSVERISEYLAMLLSEGSASQSEEDISERSHLGMPSPHQGESDRTLSPGSFNQQSLEEKLLNLERTAEAAVKRVHDMQMTEKHARASYEEVNEERILMQKHIDKQHNEIASLQVRLEELRRLDNCQCVPLQEKVSYLKEELDNNKMEFIKISQKNKNLNHDLSEMEALLKCREAEIKRLQRDSIEKAKNAMKDKLENKKDPPVKVSVTETSENVSGSIEELRDLPEAAGIQEHLIFSSKPPLYQLTSSSDLLTSPAPSSQQDPSLSTINSTGSKSMHDDAGHEKTYPVSRSGNESSSDSGDKETITITKEEYQSLHSALEELGLVKVENEVLQKEIHSLNDYQAKLEEDFRSSQQLLEAREEEILQLTEEMVDGGPQPLASETLQMQQTCQHLEEQLSAVQVQYEELYGTNIEYKNELDKITVKYEELQLETEKLKSTNESLMADIDLKTKALTKMEEKHLEFTRCLSDQNSKLQDELMKTQKTLENEKSELKCKQLKINQLHSELSAFHQEQAEKSSRFGKDKEVLEQYQEEIASLKRQQKQLIFDYEERLSAQIKCLAEKYVKEKEAAVTQQVKYYEAALHNANKENENKAQYIQNLEQRLQQNTTSGHLSDSLEDLGEGVREEVSKSSRLDRSLVSYYMESGLEGCESVQPSTRASSVGDEADDVKSQLQVIINKIQQEGVQVLTSSERRFLHKYGSFLSSTEKDLVAGLDLSEPSSRESSVCKLDIRERMQYVRRIAELESDISQKDHELKRLASQTDFRLEQERLLSNEWKLSLEDEKRRKQELTEQLRQEKLSCYDHTSELTFLRSQLTILGPKLQKLQEENIRLCESIEETTKHIDTLNVALQTERSNFSVVSKALNDQRSLAETTKSRHAKLVKDLQNSLKEERDKNEKILKELQENKFNKRRGFSGSEESVKGITKSGLKNANSRSSLDDLQTRLAIEQERVVELQRKYDIERGKVANLGEQASIERARARTELMEEQARCAELTAVIKNNQLEKENLLRMMSQDKERLRQRELLIRDLENKLSKMESELQAQTTACQVTSHKVREGDAQLHMRYNQAVQKLGEAEAEICSVKQMVRSLKNEIEECRERELSVLEELKRERTAIDRLGLPALARSNNLNEYFELQVKENLQLCKLVLKNMDEKDALRKTISNLESKIQDLTQKYAKANSEKIDSSSNEVYLKREVRKYTEKVVSLENALSQKDAELQSRANNGSSNMCLNCRMPHVYDENVRLRSRWKSLLYQKQYLLSCLRTYKDSEVQVLARMHNIAEGYNPAGRSRAEATCEKKQIRCKLKVYAIQMIAINRMKFLVKRWKYARRIGSHTLQPLVTNAQTGRLVERTSETAARIFTGALTPPTRDPMNLPRTDSLQSTSCRALFVDRESREYDKYIERLDSIHSQLGLNVKK